MMIVITTPTGQIGGQVLDRVLHSGQQVRVVARDPARLSARARDRAEVVEGSHADAGVVARALAGADAALWVVPPDPRAESLQEHVLGFVRPLCAALAERDVRVVGVSSLGRGVARAAGQISAVFAMDDLIESTGVAYRSLCMPGFMDNLLWQVAPIRDQGAFRLPMSATRKVPACATRDVAAVAAELLLDPSWSGQESVPVVGPEDLSHAEMARIMSEVLERPVRFEEVSAEAYGAALTAHGMSEPWARGLLDMTAAVDHGLYDTAPPPAARRPGGTSFRAWCEDVLRPAVLA